VQHGERQDVERLAWAIPVEAEIALYGDEISSAEQIPGVIPVPDPQGLLAAAGACNRINEILLGYFRANV
jgi:hypothetical protein